MTKVILPRLSDMHLHLRQGQMLNDVATYSARQCQRVMVMPNTIPAVTTAAEAIAYRKQIEKRMPYVDVQMTIKLTPNTTPQTIREAKAAGVVAVKLYPDGVTTNSDGGISAGWLTDHPQLFLDTIEEIRKQDMVFCMHPEMPGVFVLDREHAFLNFVDFVLKNFKGIRVVLEHITSSCQINFIHNNARTSKIAGTITAHHLILTLNDVINDFLYPHNFCKPVAKSIQDRDDLIKAATRGEPYFFLGSDSAPHKKENKECAESCAGIFSAPFLIECLLEVFEKDSLKNLPNFIHYHASDFYKLPRLDSTMVCTICPSWVPLECGGIRPFRAGERIRWSMC